MRAVALLTSLSLLGCFPHDPHARSIAKYSEGGAILLGIGVLALAGTGADCDANQSAAMPDSSCHTKATVLSDIGLSLLIGGLVGFIATVSTAEEDKPVPTTVIKAEPVKPEPVVPTPLAVPAPTPAPSPDAPPAP